MHPAAISDTRSAKPARGGDATRHTSQQSSEGDAADVVADSGAADVVTAGTGA